MATASRSLRTIWSRVCRLPRRFVIESLLTRHRRATDSHSNRIRRWGAGRDGMGGVAASGEERTIRFLDLAPEDLGTSIVESVPAAMASELPPANNRRSWRLGVLLFGNVVVITIVALLRIWTKKSQEGSLPGDNG
ncbi:MAG: hypothetical protein ACF8TS_02855 [Maioricimonas sp. JB049]